MRSRRLMQLVSCAFIAALAIPSPLAPQNQQEPKKQVFYIVKDLGTLGGSGGQGSTAEAISNRGWIVGTSDMPGDMTVHGFVWREGQMMDLGTLGGLNTAEYGTNISRKTNQIAGTSQTSDADPLGENWGLLFNCTTNGTPCDGFQNLVRGFVWQDGVLTTLPTLGGNNDQASGINDYDQVVGWAENSVQDPTCPLPPYSNVLDYEPVIWERQNDGAFHVRELPRIAGDTNGMAGNLNDRGQITGFTSDCPQSATHAVLWAGSTITDMGNLGGTFNFPGEINSHGQVIGISAITGNTTGHAFLWQKGSIMTDLGTLPGDFFSFAFGINDEGVIVGGSCSGFFSGCRAVLWQSGAMTDLNTLVRPGSTPLQLFFGNDINDRGEIAIYAFNPTNGELRAALAIPCDESHADVEACAEGTTPIGTRTGENPKVALPENIRGQLLKRMPFERFISSQQTQ